MVLHVLDPQERLPEGDLAKALESAFVALSPLEGISRTRPAIIRSPHVGCPDGGDRRRWQRRWR